MKKLLALLLACMMPLCALADTYGISISVEAEEDVFLPFVTDILMSQPGAEEEAVEKNAAILQKLIDGMGIEASFQDNAYTMNLHVDGQGLFDLTGYEKDDQLFVTTSLVPGYVLSSPMAETEATELDKIDWVSVGLSVISTIDAWVDALEKTEMRGVFVGDAFEDGTKCTAWHFSDKDLVELVESLLNDDVCAALKFLCVSAELNADDLFATLDEMNARVAQENSYNYILRAVYAHDDRLTGLSLTVSKEGDQVATASLGVHDNGIKAVVGLGFTQQNYWCSITSSHQASENGFHASVILREWSASKEDAFSYVEGVTAPANIQAWEMDVAQVEGSYSWNGMAAVNGNTLLKTDGVCKLDDLSLKGKILFGPDEAPVLGVNILSGAAQEIPLMDEALEVYSLSDEAAAEQISMKISTELITRLMKLMLGK